MNTLTDREMASISGGGDALWSACGFATGVTFGATVFFGGLGFMLTVNKALATCGLAAFL
jgi:bacteriocin-like protein